MLKIIIVLLLFGVIASLTSGLVFLFKDTEQPDSKRTLYALGVRITLGRSVVIRHCLWLLYRRAAYGCKRAMARGSSHVRIG